MSDNLLDRQLHFGLYRGICQNNQDPTGHNRIQVSIPDLYGNTYITDWIPGCLPVTSNADHPDHLAHSATFTTTSGGTPTHSHNVTVTFNDHEHAATSDPLDPTTTSPHHTPHRKVPNVGQVVWIMFEKGDPNFPIWMGVYL